MIILINNSKEGFVYLRKCSRDCCLPLFCIIIFVMQLEVDNQTLAQKAKEFEEREELLGNIRTWIVNLFPFLS